MSETDWRKMDWSVAGITKAMETARAQMQASREREMRGWSEAIEKVKCQKCGCNPTLTNSGSGDALEMCSTIYAALKRQAPVIEAGTHGIGDLQIRVTPCDADFPEWHGLDVSKLRDQEPPQ
jgi:hypothetical protein